MKNNLPAESVLTQELVQNIEECVGVGGVGREGRDVDLRSKHGGVKFRSF